MLVRNLDIVVFGAERPFAVRAVEALLALGANVVAAAALRTELDRLRGELRHHHRLHVAECSAADDHGVRSLLEATRRRGKLDAVVLVLPAAPSHAEFGGAEADELLALARALTAVDETGDLPVVLVADAARQDALSRWLARGGLARDFSRRTFYDADAPAPALDALLMLLSPSPPADRT